MLTSVFTKAVRDRWTGTTMGTAILALLLLMAMAVYTDIDLSVYTNLPEAMRAVMGIPAGADAAALSYSVMFGTMASLTLAGLALSMGSRAIAGEERAGTLGLLLANPRSRTRVLASKAASMVVLLAVAALLLWGAGLAVPALLGVEIGTTHVGAMALHLGVNALFYGFLALAVGSWTGNGTLASGTTVAVMVVSFVAVGLLPMIEGAADLAKALPWYYFDGSQPLTNGVSWGHLAVLAGGMLVFAGVALVGVNRRDLRDRSATSLFDRLRTNPTTRKVVDRLAGSARVSALWVKTASEHQGILVVTAAVMVGMGALMGPMYTAIDDQLAGMMDSLPEAVLALVGNGDISTPEGWFQVEMFSLMVPIAMILVTATIGARALAGEEAGRTMGLLLANPIRRSRVVLHKAVALVLFAVVVGIASFAGMALGALVAGLDVSYGGLAAATLLGMLLGLVFGALALALSAATGRMPVAVYGTAGAALTFYLLNAFLGQSANLAGYARWSPFYYYLGGDPLNAGIHWGYAAVLASLAAALVAVAVGAFQRRDLRQSG